MWSIFSYRNRKFATWCNREFLSSANGRGRYQSMHNQGGLCPMATRWRWKCQLVRAPSLARRKTIHYDATTTRYTNPTQHVIFIQQNKISNQSGDRSRNIATPVTRCFWSIIEHFIYNTEPNLSEPGYKWSHIVIHGSAGTSLGLICLRICSSLAWVGRAISEKKFDFENVDVEARLLVLIVIYSRLYIEHLPFFLWWSKLNVVRNS